MKYNPDLKAYYYISYVCSVIIFVAVCKIAFWATCVAQVCEVTVAYVLPYTAKWENFRGWNRKGPFKGKCSW